MPENNYVQLTLDTRGNVTESRAVAKTGPGPGDIVTTAVYPSSCANPVTCNLPTSTTDANGNTTTYAYDPTHGGVLSVTAPAVGGVQPQTRYSYTPITNGVTGASVYLVTGSSTCRTTAGCIGTADETTTTTIGYETGNLLPVSTTVAAGDGSLSTSTSVGYDAIGNVASVTDARGNVTNAYYNANRQVTGVMQSDPDGAGPLDRPAVDVSYDASGQVVAQTEGRVNGSGAFIGHRQMQYGYDAAHRKVADALVSGSIYTYTRYGYDVAGRLECTAVRMNPSVFGGQPNACLSGTTGSDGPDRITRATYDAAGRTASVTSGYGVIGTESMDARYTYTANGQVASATDAEDHVTSYAYDGFDRLFEQIHPSPTTAGQVDGADYEAYLYDANGNRTYRRSRDGRAFTYAYDALNRLTTKYVPDGCSGLGGNPCLPAWATRDVYYGYDLLGRLTSARFDSAVGEGIVAGYDALGRQVSETSTLGGVGRTVSSGYDIGGNRVRVTHPDGVYFDYGYDGLNRMKNAWWWSPGSGTVPFMAITYDQQGRRGDMNRASSFTGYDYDPVSRLGGMNQRFAGNAGNVTTTFGYNPAGQITVATKYNDDYVFANHVGADRSYTTNGLNQYVAAGPVSFGYDKNGNLNASGSTSFTYDAENRLVSSNSGASLAYDPLGRLWQSSDGTNVTTFLYDGDHVAAEYNANTGSLTRRYMWGPGADEPILIDEGGMNCSTTRFAHTDERGSVIALADCFGNRTKVNAYDEYGVPNVGYDVASSAGGRFGYTGQMWLPELGLWYYKARMYSPTLGRFMQTDPIGYADGMNMYDYVGGDPVNATDPSGLGPQQCDQQVGSGSCLSLPFEVTVIGRRLSFDASTAAQSFSAPSSSGGGPAIQQAAGQAMPQNDVVVVARRAALAGVGLGTKVLGGPLSVMQQLVSSTNTACIAMEGCSDPNIMMVLDKDRNKTVEEALRQRRASIRNAPLPKGSPSWSNIGKTTLAEIQARARAGDPEYKTIHKLLNDSRFLK